MTPRPVKTVSPSSPAHNTRRLLFPFLAVFGVLIYFQPSTSYADTALGVSNDIALLIPEKKLAAPVATPTPTPHMGRRAREEPIRANMEAALPHLTTHLPAHRPAHSYSAGHLHKPHDEGFPTIQERRWGAAVKVINMPDQDLKPGNPAALAQPRRQWDEYTPPDITRGSGQKMRLSITFDGGSEDDDAKEILDTLSTRGIKTTIFLTGAFIKKFPTLVKRMLLDGHEIGNHTMNHPHLTDFEKTLRHGTLSGVDRTTIQRELRDAAAAFKAATGEEMSPLWRAPYGEVNDEIRRWAFEAGYIHIGWTSNNKKKESLDTLDWVNDRKSRFYRSSFEIKKRILDFGKDGSGINGGIALMHLGTGRKSDRAASILPDLLDALERRGYKLVKVSDLVDETTQLQAVKSVRKERVLEGFVRLKSAQ